MPGTIRCRASARRVLRGGVTSLLLVLIVVGGLSHFWSARYVGTEFVVGVFGGMLVWCPYAMVAYTDPPVPMGFHVWWRPWKMTFRWPVLGAGDRGFGILPLWMPVAVAAVPTTLLWYRGRRRWPPGHCQRCGYDLTGNVSGRCPECGTAIEATAR